MDTIDRKEMERRARVASKRMDLPEDLRNQFKSAADKLEVVNGLEAALERRRFTNTNSTQDKVHAFNAPNKKNSAGR